MRPSTSPKRAVLVIVAGIAGLFLMPSLLSPLFAAKVDPAYPRLSENLAGSQHLEVRKVLQGEIKGMFALPESRQVIVAAGSYLWKFSADGVLQDSLREPDAMDVSGIAFGKDGYVDWVLTGQRDARPYGPEVDGDALSDQALVAELDRAQVVAFGKDDDHAWGWLWADGRAWKLRLDRRREQVDTWCRRRTHSDEKLHWSATCFEGHTAAAARMVEVEPESFWRARDRTERVRVTGFDRRTYHLEEGVSGQLIDATVGTALRIAGVPGGGPGRYWFGDAHVQLDVAGETVQFKAFVPREGDGYGFIQTMRWWEPAQVLPGASPWFSVRMREYSGSASERKLLDYYVADIGLYAVRPKGADAAPPAPRPVPAWRPRFEGEQTRFQPVTATVELEGGARVDRWLRPPPPMPVFEGEVPRVVVEPVQSALGALPVAMNVRWGSQTDPDARTELRVELDGAQVWGALQAAAAGPRELVLRVPDLYAPVSKMEVLLRDGDTEHPLPGARLVVVSRPAFRPHREGTPSRYEQLRANATLAAGGDMAALDEFLRQSGTLAADPGSAENFAASVTASYAELINAFNVAGRTDASARLVRHYLAQVHPHTATHLAPGSEAYNIGVIASQTLAFSIHEPANRDLVDAVMSTLLGPDFDPARQTNGTLMYNLACFYAVDGDATRMLEAVANARRLGKPSSQFMGDSDFEAYREDPRFLAALEQQG